MNKKLKIVVTGGAGFIASHVVDAYIKNNHEVIVIDNLSTGFKENVNPAAKFYEYDICSKDAQEVIMIEKPDIINHHAAQIDVRKSVANPLVDIDVNVKGFIGLLEATKNYKLKKVVLASTGGAIYGEQDYFPADENHQLSPISPYGINKLTSEKYLHYYKMQYGIEYSALRYANVYGPRQNALGEAGVVAVFTTKFLNNEQPYINGNGEQTRDYIYVSDVVKANMLVTEQIEAVGAYNVGTSVETDVTTLFDIIRNITGSSFERKFMPSKPGEQLRSSIISKRLKKELGWEPEVKLADGLKITIDWFKTKSNKIKLSF